MLETMEYELEFVLNYDHGIKYKRGCFIENDVRTILKLKLLSNYIGYTQIFVDHNENVRFWIDAILKQCKKYNVEYTEELIIELAEEILSMWQYQNFYDVSEFNEMRIISNKDYNYLEKVDMKELLVGVQKQS